MLDKAIEHGKEKRKPYRGAKAVDRGCRNHGSCPYCTNNRTFKKKLGKGKKVVVDTLAETIEAERDAWYGHYEEGTFII